MPFFALSTAANIYEVVCLAVWWYTVKLSESLNIVTVIIILLILKSDAVDSVIEQSDQ